VLIRGSSGESTYPPNKGDHHCQDRHQGHGCAESLIVEKPAEGECANVKCSFHCAGSGVEARFGVPLAANRFAYVFGQRIKFLRYTRAANYQCGGRPFEKAAECDSERLWQPAKEASVTRQAERATFVTCFVSFRRAAARSLRFASSIGLLLATFTSLMGTVRGCYFGR
jgi:hypothetical protein